ATPTSSLSSWRSRSFSLPSSTRSNAWCVPASATAITSNGLSSIWITVETKATVRIFLDDEPKPLGEFVSPVTFDLDTHRLPDGKHVLKILSKDVNGREGIRVIPFVVRNGPAIDVEGLKAADTVDGVLPVMINAYGRG